MGYKQWMYFLHVYKLKYAVFFKFNITRYVSSGTLVDDILEQVIIYYVY